MQNQKPGSRTILVFLSLILLTSACSTLGAALGPQVIKPTVTMDRIEIKNPSLSDATAVFKLQVDNPNSFSLNLDKITYDLTLNEKKAATGVFEEGLSLPAKAKSPVDIPVHIQFSEIFGSISSMLHQDKTSYKVEGTLSSGMIQIPYRKEGEVKLSELNSLLPH